MVILREDFPVAEQSIMIWGKSETFTFFGKIKDEYSLEKTVTGNHKCNGTVGIESREIRKKRHPDRWKEILR